MAWCGNAGCRVRGGSKWPEKNRPHPFLGVSALWAVAWPCQSVTLLWSLRVAAGGVCVCACTFGLPCFHHFFATGFTRLVGENGILRMGGITEGSMQVGGFLSKPALAGKGLHSFSWTLVLEKGNSSAEWLP